jgi:hypothetical protein
MHMSTIVGSSLVSRCAVAASLLWLAVPSARGQDSPRLSQLLPQDVAETTDVYAWGWLEYLQSDNRTRPEYWTTDLALGLTRHLSDRAALSIDFHGIDENDATRGSLEQAFVSIKLDEASDSLLTIGKFNAGIGVEPRNAWDRLAGTTSLLFGAVPQDAIGVMLTQPIGTTGLKVRPFITNGFPGRFDFRQPPAAGAVLDYQPSQQLKLGWTNWVGGGFAPNSYQLTGNAVYYGGASDTYYGARYAYGNWVGPRLPQHDGGILYLSDLHAEYVPRQDLTLQAELLLATDSSATSGLAWGGASAMANYDLTDKLRFYGRYSFLNDSTGVVTGFPNRQHELSAGAAYAIFPGGDLLLEYRHDFSDTQGDLNAVSLHLVFSY